VVVLTNAFSLLPSPNNYLAQEQKLQVGKKVIFLFLFEFPTSRHNFEL
jgi:hypothetical protein